MSRQHYHLSEHERPARVSVRMPERLKRTIARLAFDEGRSENALMIEALESYVTQKTAARSED